MAIKSIMCSHIILRLRASCAARDAVINWHHRSVHSGAPAFDGLQANDNDNNGGVSEARFARFVTTTGILGASAGDVVDEEASRMIRVTRHHGLDWATDDALELITPPSRPRSVDKHLLPPRIVAVSGPGASLRGQKHQRARVSLPAMHVQVPLPARTRPRSDPLASSISSAASFTSPVVEYLQMDTQASAADDVGTQRGECLGTHNSGPTA